MKGTRNFLWQRFAIHISEWQVIKNLGTIRALSRHATFGQNPVALGQAASTRNKWMLLACRLTHVRRELNIRWAGFLEWYIGICAVMPRPIMMCFLGMDHLDNKPSISPILPPPPGYIPRDYGRMISDGTAGPQQAAALTEIQCRLEWTRSWAQYAASRSDFYWR